MFPPLGIRKVYRTRIFTVGWKVSPSLVKSGTFEEVKCHVGRRRRSKKGIPRVGAALRHPELGSCLPVFQGKASTQPAECPHGTHSMGPAEDSVSVMVRPAPRGGQWWD